MANFINKINIGGEIYNIGMENAVHFDGISKIGTWFSDSSCTVTANVADLTNKDFLYYNGDTIGTNAVVKGCMYIPSSDDGGKNATGYELVCVDVTDGVSKWAILGEIKKETGSAVIDVTTEDKTVATGVSATKAEVLVSVTPGTKEIVAGVSTASYNVITAAPGTVSAAAQEVATSVTPGTATINYGTSISDGSISVKRITAAAPVSAVVSGGAVDAKTGSVDVEINEAAGEAGKVGITLASKEEAVATGVSATNVSAVTDTTSNAFGTAATYKVDGNTLILPATLLTGATKSSVIGSVEAVTGKISVPSAAAMAANVITAVNVTPVTHTVSGVVTSVSHTNPTVTLPTSVVTGVEYTAPVLTTADQQIVSGVVVSSKEIGAFAADAAVVTSVPYAAKTVAVGASEDKITVVTGVTTGAVSAVTGVTADTATIKTVSSVTKGTVVTAVL